MLSSANFFSTPSRFLWPVGRYEHLLWLVGARRSVAAKISGKSHQLAEALPGNISHCRSPLHPPSYFKLTCRCVIPPHPRIFSVLHIFVLKFRAPCWKLPSVSLDCVMSFIYYIFSSSPSPKLLEKLCLRAWKDLIASMCSTALLSWVWVGLSPMQRLPEPPLCVPAAPPSSGSMSQLEPRMNSYFQMSPLKIPSFAFFSLDSPEQRLGLFNGWGKELLSQPWTESCAKPLAALLGLPLVGHQPSMPSVSDPAGAEGDAG